MRGDLPANDPIDLAARYELTDGRAPPSKPFAGEAEVGHSREFFVQRISGAAFSGDVPPETATITATLAAKSQHAYFYVDDVLQVERADAEAAASAFESMVWPQVTRIFGEPDIPGVDGDPRIIVLQADLGGAVGGYYSPDDGFLRSVRPRSNEAEMVYMDRTLRIGGGAFNVVLAHELQHLIHARLDSDEEAWINEGLSEAASALVGGALSSVSGFSVRPNIQLNAWSSEGSAAHYGASAAFVRYLAHRFGEDEQLGTIATAPGDGAAGIDEFLDDAGIGLSFRDVFADWIAANSLDRLEGPYSNPGPPVNVRVENRLSINETVEGQATQFGTDYYLLDSLGNGQHTLRFDGAPSVDVLPAAAPDGGAMWWSNAQDDINTMLTHEIDLTDVSAPVLTFKTWFDIESWYDWGYVAISDDGGDSWRAVAGEHATSDDPVRIAYGPGYTGTSGGEDEPGWVEERIDLSEFADRRVLIRFEYVTDGSTHGEGWAIAGAEIETGSSRATRLDGAWDTAGWVLVDEPLQQTWIVRLIAEGQGGEPVVRDARLDDDGSGDLTFDAAGLRDIVVAVAGATEGTRQQAPYTMTLTSSS